MKAPRGPGRPPLGPRGSAEVHVKLPAEQVVRLDHLAMVWGETRSEVVRRLLGESLERRTSGSQEESR